MPSIRAWRLSKHLVVESAAELVGVTPATWRNWESGRRVPTPKHLMNLSKVTKIKPEILYKEALQK